MFDNIGNKVKGLAIFACVVGMVGSLIGAIVLWSNGLIGAGFGTLIGGCLSAWIGSWVVYCIGDTNARTSELQEQIRKMQEIVNRLGTLPEKKPVASIKNPVGKTEQPQKPVTQEEMREASKLDPQAKPLEDGFTRAIPVNERKEKCGNCGTVQPAGRHICWNCDMRFQRDEEV